MTFPLLRPLMFLPPGASVSVFLGVWLIGPTPLFAQDPLEHARVPLFRASQIEFSGDGGSKEFNITLPRHIEFQAGSELSVALHPLTDPLSQPAAIAMLWNGRLLGATNLPGTAGVASVLRLRLPEQALRRGANTLSLRVVSQADKDAPPTVAGPARWSLPRAECHLDLAFTRPALFEELGRFPEDLAEEQLLRVPASEADAGRNVTTPVLTILIPGRCGEVHLRVAAIVAARLGQLDYLEDEHCRLAALESWKEETLRRNAVIIARRDQLGGIQLPPALAAMTTGLMASQGVIGEFFEGRIPHQRRVLLVSGVDDAGLENAALTLGSAPALATILRSPALIDRAPTLVVAAPAPAEAPRIQGLYQVQEFLQADRFARQAAYAVPAGPTLAQVRGLFSIWMRLGRALPEAPVLWPEVITYKEHMKPDEARLRGRNVLALGAISQWPALLPAGAKRPAIRLAMAEDLVVVMQGRRQRRVELEPTLAFAQLMVSPWSRTNWLVLTGGWRDYDLPATRRLLLDPTTPQRLAGDLAAMDGLGREASYDLHHVASESFAERVRRRIPPDLGAAETARRVAMQEARLDRSRRSIRSISPICGGILALLVAVRLLFTWQQARLRDRVLAADRAAGGTG